MKEMKWILFFVFILTGCPQKPENTAPAAISVPAMPKIATKVKKDESLLSKEQREAIYFSASLEREAMRLLTKNPSFDELTLFSTLSYAIETYAGIKKMAPSKLDCSRFSLRPDASNKKIVSVFKTCSKPDSLMAQIKMGLASSELQVIFYIREWVSVIGLAGTLTGSNIVCDLRIDHKKLTRLNCQNWVRTLSSDEVSAEELRLTTFAFDRNNANQFVLQGGVFKDLVERRKVEIKVPLQGKIKLIEKEIEVIDQFAETIEAPVAPQESRSSRIQIQGVSDDKKNQEIPDSQNQQTQSQGESYDEVLEQNHEQGFEQAPGQSDGENGGIPPEPQPRSR
ncbi:MAG: hypothetical protein A2622_07720 [Bdellovibrionales bacterium RIFCSPHIGHO2_01_FULL_40_29]|nr:MAG: hypothetical protein A2622_07720 [Bdellovibrionales bacterium RIFCSPHIGHO2_01_FULL_40_29]OFZ34192.1 MAG: hypothetical protein A3D17_03930 [Bdellovibrionales bacterium RIFCSPHIGHO2_02_FULL_40_15]